MATPADTVRRFYDALGRGDVPAVLSLLMRRSNGAAPGGGPQAVVDNLLKPLSTGWDGFSAKAHEFIAQGERVVSLGTYSGTFKKTGRSLSAAFAHVWTVRGDKLAKYDQYTDNAKVLEAAKG
jgi:uncharacterized protein